MRGCERSASNTSKKRRAWPGLNVTGITNAPLLLCAATGHSEQVAAESNKKRVNLRRGAVVGRCGKLLQPLLEGPHESLEL